MSEPKQTEVRCQKCKAAYMQDIDCAAAWYCAICYFKNYTSTLQESIKATFDYHPKEPEFCRDTLERPYTKEELRTQFLDHIRVLVSYWCMQTGSDKEKLTGLAHSILVIFDGQIDIDNEEQWIEDGTAINDGCYLHELL